MDDCVAFQVVVSSTLRRHGVPCGESHFQQPSIAAVHHANLIEHHGSSQPRGTDARLLYLNLVSYMVLVLIM
jgi:hypothetical protein